MIKADDFIKIPLKELEKPQNSHICLLNRSWIVHEGAALVYTGHGDYAPQMNTSPLIKPTELHEKLFPGVELRLVPVSYIPAARYLNN